MREQVGPPEQPRQIQALELLQVAWRGHGKPFVVQQALAVECQRCLRRLVCKADGDVRLALLEVDGARGRIDGDGNVRVATLKGRERRHQPQPCERGQGADAHHVAPQHQAAEGGLQRLQRGAGLLVQPGPLGAERDHARGAVEQRGAQQLFQFADAVADGAVRKVQFFGRLLEALASRHGIEGGDEVKGRDVAHGWPASYWSRARRWPVPSSVLSFFANSDP
ncbi:hypothetical protein N5K37_31110 [Delftia tsuruhatensis]|uniref:Uncharacterized protein n=1 Tax=Delftia tsuruhatensis TaxID=180282 RepID=A0AAX3SUG1_9BURK|nr:hypothetical protein [Delftia tsuruhatensis]MDH2234370.1 hypothetical protein [Delftia tsuruhatensis]WFF83655.1 hypothetical protein PYR84_13450 [Delftia tsuruhatensis]